MTRSGGLFVAIMGAGVALGGALPSWRKPLLALGAALAVLALILIGPRIQAHNPNKLQLWFLFGSIALEIILIRLAFALYAAADALWTSDGIIKVLFGATMMLWR